MGIVWGVVWERCGGWCCGHDIEVTVQDGRLFMLQTRNGKRSPACPSCHFPHPCFNQDIEFTVQDGRLFMLQTRNGKRTGTAALQVATDLVK